ncbi:MAG: hypothetical protein ABIH82_00245 [Candidatus Woesearchaeota archaeon]
MSKKEVKEYSKHLNKAISWAAAEYKYLDYLKREFKHVEEDKDISKEIKDLKKAAKLLRYVSKAERRAYKFEQRVGKDVHSILEEKGLSPELVEGFQVFLKQFKIEEDQLVKLTDWYNGELDNELDKEKVLLQLEKKAGSSAKQKKIHQEFLQILHDMEQHVGQAEEWIAGLEATLEKAKQMFKMLPNDEKQEVLKEGMLILRDYGFPVDGFPNEAELMAQHPDDLVEMAKVAGGNASKLFELGLPAVAEAGIITEKRWPGLVEMAKAAGENAWRLFEEGLPVVAREGIITEKTWPGLVKMAKAVGENAYDLFEDGLPAVAGLIQEDFVTTFNFIHYLIKKFPGHYIRIIQTVGELSDADLVKTTDFKTVAKYLEVFHVLNKTSYEIYLEQPLNQRNMWLKNYKAQYEDIVMGKNNEIKQEFHDLILYAVNSAELSRDVLNDVLSSYGEQAQNLSTPFSEFEIKVKEADWVRNKLDTTFLTQTQQMFKSFPKDFDNKRLVKLQEMFELEKDKEYQNLINNKSQLFPLTILYLFDKERLSRKQGTISWGLLVEYAFITKASENMKHGCLNLIEQDPNKQRNNISSCIEFFNDTIKDVMNQFKDIFQQKTFDNFLLLHRKNSGVDRISAQMNKFKLKKGGSLTEIFCLPSKQPLDLFYGYYGENCTSTSPEELLNEKFTPVRLIVEKEILGCIHFYIHKNMLFILGIEPKESLMKHLEPKNFLKKVVDEAIKQAKKLNLKKVCFPSNETAHSNRPALGQAIINLISGKESFSSGIVFPKGEYDMGDAHIVWEE